MKIDTGFWRKDGTYIENIEDLELEDYNEILLDENKYLKERLSKLENFITWLLTQQYYVLPKNLRKRAMEVLIESEDNQ